MENKMAESAALTPNIYGYLIDDNDENKTTAGTKSIS